MPETNARILVVEDNPLVLKLVCTRLAREGYDVEAASSSTLAMRSVGNNPPDLMVLDLSLVDGDPFGALLDGFGVLTWLRRVLPEIRFPVIIYTVDNSPNLEETALANGVFAVCRKAGKVDNLIRTIRRALGQEEAA